MLQPGCHTTHKGTWIKLPLGPALRFQGAQAPIEHVPAIMSPIVLAVYTPNTAMSLDRDCVCSQDKSPYIKLYLLRITMAVTLQCLILNFLVLTVRLSL